MIIETHIESDFEKAFEPNFCVAPSLDDSATTFFIFRETSYKVWREIRVRVINREIICKERLEKEEITYLNKNIV